MLVSVKRRSNNFFGYQNPYAKFIRQHQSLKYTIFAILFYNCTSIGYKIFVFHIKKPIIVIVATLFSDSFYKNLIDR